MGSSACGERMPCPDCGSSDAVQAFINEDKALGLVWYTSFCFGKCWDNKGDPYGSKEPPKAHIKTEAEVREEVAVIKSCKLFDPKKPYRGIPAEYYKRWGCRLLYSEFDGKTPYAIGFPYSNYGKLVGWKARAFKLNAKGKKSFWGIGRTTDVDPFGLVRALHIGGDALYITEGEFDAIALDYCLSMVGNSRGYPVVSLTAGGGSIEKNFDHIKTRVRHRFKYIVLVLDDDDVGKKAENTAKELWPEVIVVSKPKGSKDANDAVKAGKAVEMGNLALNFKRE